MGTKVSWNECVSDTWYVCSCRSAHCPPARPLLPYHAVVQLITVSVQFEGVKISIPIQVESIGHHNQTTMNPIRIGGAGREPRYQVARLYDVSYQDDRSIGETVPSRAADMEHAQVVIEVGEWLE